MPIQQHNNPEQLHNLAISLFTSIKVMGLAFTNLTYLESFALNRLVDTTAFLNAQPQILENITKKLNNLAMYQKVEPAADVILAEQEEIPVPDLAAQAPVNNQQQPPIEQIQQFLNLQSEKILQIDKPQLIKINRLITQLTKTEQTLENLIELHNQMNVL